MTVLDGIKKAYPDTSIVSVSGLSRIYLCSGGKYVGMDESGHLYLTEKDKAECFTFTDWGCGSTTLVACSNGKFVTLEEEDPYMKAGREEAFSWFIRESWNFRPVGKEKDMPRETYYLDSWNGMTVTADSSGFLVCGTKEGEPAVFTIEVEADGIKEAVHAAENAQRAVLVLGCNPVINSKEEIDRSTLALPPFQQNLADAVRKANPETIVVLLSNYPYSINRLQEEMPGIIWSASGSQELGTGVASILSGKVSPAGRLNMTWYISDEDLPDMNDYDIIKGKRTYQYFDREVLYPFGYGLSYSEFTYGKLNLEKRRIR